MSLATRRLVMLCAVLGIVLAGLDGAIANIALPTIARELACSETATVWIVNAYQIAVAVCLLPAAALGESIGIKRVYGFGMALFTAASLGCAMAPSIGALVSARVVQGIGGACMAALSGALVRSTQPRETMHRAFATIALAVAISAAIGPTLAAGILAVATWPWLFLINVPIGVVAVPLFFRVTPMSARRPQSFDVAGTLLNIGTLGLVVLGVDALGHGQHTLAMAEIAASLLCGACLYRQQRHRPAPLLPLDLLAIPLFSLSIATSICAYAAQILAYVSLPFLFQNVMHRSAIATGLLVTPWPLLVAFAAPWAGRLATRYPSSLLSSIGLGVLACGLLALALMPAQPAIADVIWRMALSGIGFGFYQTPNNLTVMTAGPAMRSGAASGMLAVARTMGWSFGSALVVVMFGLSSGSGGAIDCLYLAVAFALSGAILSASRGAIRHERGA
ncbi:transporter [Neoasaia chiangmaiensis NBRC 101099]|nr:transporter [Neoasaia chiangmaiensis NBRC 101099]